MDQFFIILKEIILQPSFFTEEKTIPFWNKISVYFSFYYVLYIMSGMQNKIWRSKKIWPVTKEKQPIKAYSLITHIFKLAHSDSEIITNIKIVQKIGKMIVVMKNICIKNGNSKKKKFRVMKYFIWNKINGWSQY